MGSNPTLSARKIIYWTQINADFQDRKYQKQKRLRRFFYYLNLYLQVSAKICVLNNINGEMTELAEGARLEIVCSAKSGTVGSNPTLSAMHHVGCMAALNST